jgi:hypothetical protein
MFCRIEKFLLKTLFVAQKLYFVLIRTVYEVIILGLEKSSLKIPIDIMIQDYSEKILR